MYPKGPCTGALATGRDLTVLWFLKPLRTLTLKLSEPRPIFFEVSKPILFVRLLGPRTILFEGFP